MEAFLDYITTPKRYEQFARCIEAVSAYTKGNTYGVHTGTQIHRLHRLSDRNTKYYFSARLDNHMRIIFTTRSEVPELLLLGPHDEVYSRAEVIAANGQKK